MILYRLSGRVAPHNIPAWIDPVVDPNLVTVRREANKLRADADKNKFLYDLRLQKLTIRKLDQAAVIEALRCDDLYRLVEHCETLDRWANVAAVV
jgi:hypothetical protein